MNFLSTEPRPALQAVHDGCVSIPDMAEVKVVFYFTFISKVSFLQVLNMLLKVPCQFYTIFNEL